MDCAFRRFGHYVRASVLEAQLSSQTLKLKLFDLRHDRWVTPSAIVFLSKFADTGLTSLFFV